MIGKTLGAYLIQDQIGMGGMATVYKAYHAAVDRYVAVKVLPAHFAQDPKFLKRFEQEARLIARLEHRNILPVYDFGEQDGITYLVMRYLDAGTLRDLLQTGPLSLKQAADYLSQIASALDYAHQLNVIHRDVKPANVLVDQHGGAFVSDFGIAKMVGGSMDLTGSGLIGTPTYMAPEQGTGQKASPLSDQYALGVVLYEMVVGHVPYQAETPAAVLLMHMQSPLPLPSQARPGLPEAVERVILRVLAKNPADRFPDCTTFAEAFEQAVAGLPVDIAVRPEAIEETVAITPPGEITSPDTSAMTLDAAPSTTPPAPAGRMPIWLWPTIAVLGIAALSAAVYFGLRGLGMVPGPGGSPIVTEQPEGDAPPGEEESAESEPESAAPAPTTAPTSPTAPDEGLSVEFCKNYEAGAGLCILPADGSDPIRILEDSDLDFRSSRWPTWSPDGQRIAFAAFAPGDDFASLYVVDADGSDLTRLTFDGYHHYLAWSPDGEWIAHHYSGGSMALIRPDGTDFTVLQPSFDRECFESFQWSPDSQWIVTAVRPVSCTVEWGPSMDVEIRVISLDGETAIPIAANSFSTEDCGDPYKVAFSPDGRQVAYWNVDCQPVLANADGSGEPEPLDQWPYWWTSNFYPQWGGEASVAVAPEQPLGDTPAEQAENFTEPILAAIADRPPDYEDDFSDPTSGWPRGVIPDDDWTGGEIGYTEGEYFVVASPAGVSPSHSSPLTCTQGDLTTISFSDMVLEVEVRFLEKDQYMWSVDFRHSESPEGGLGYFLHADSGGLLALYRDERSGETVRLGELQGLPMQAGLETNRLQIIAVGPQLAVYANGEPALFATDRYFDERYSGGWIRLKNCNESDTPREVRFDNLRIWDLSGLQ